MSQDNYNIEQLQQKLLQSEKLASIGTLASGIAHELNNPLTGILGMAEAILDEDDLNTIKSFSKDIIDYTLGASAIVKELASYSRTIINESISKIDLTVIIKNSLNLVKLSHNLSGIAIFPDFRKECWIQANSGEMYQVFVNLITNAVQAMEEKGGQLTLICSNDGQFVKTGVKDTGTGIKKDHLSQLYSPFFTTKPPGKGTGLGLYVIDKIVSKYKGNVEVISEVGVGTSFTLTFPMKKIKE